MPCGGIAALFIEEDGFITAEPIGVKPMELLTMKEIERYYDKYNVPIHIRKHMRAVADYQDRLLDQIEEHGIYYDRDMLRKAALLHDLVRLGKNHAKTAEKILIKEGYPYLAIIIGEHHSFIGNTNMADGDGQNKMDLSMGNLLFYADKRIKETRQVSIEERFAMDDKKYSSKQALGRKESQLKRAVQIEEKLQCILKKQKGGQLCELM